MLPFRTSVGEGGLGLTEVGETAKVGEAEVGDGQVVTRETGVAGLCASGDIAACSRKEDASGS